MIEDLYTTNDIKRIRELILKEQDGFCAVTGLKIPDKQSVTDHAHDDEQLVRGILHRQINAWIGKAENAHTRLIKWWYPNDLPTLMRLCADYLEKEPTKYRHNNWIKKIQTKFNQLSESQKKVVLKVLEQPEGSNSTQRKALFKKAVLSRKYTFDYLKDLINREKEKA